MFWVHKRLLQEVEHLRLRLRAGLRFKEERFLNEVLGMVAKLIQDHGEETEAKWQIVGVVREDDAVEQLTMGRRGRAGATVDNLEELENWPTNCDDARLQTWRNIQEAKERMRLRLQARAGLEELEQEVEQAALEEAEAARADADWQNRIECNARERLEDGLVQLQSINQLMEELHQTIDYSVTYYAAKDWEEEYTGARGMAELMRQGGEPQPQERKAWSKPTAREVEPDEAWAEFGQALERVTQKAWDGRMQEIEEAKKSAEDCAKDAAGHREQERQDWLEMRRQQTAETAVVYGQDHVPRLRIVLPGEDELRQTLREEEKAQEAKAKADDYSKLKSWLQLGTQEEEEAKEGKPFISREEGAELRRRFGRYGFERREEQDD